MAFNSASSCELSGHHSILDAHKLPMLSASTITPIDVILADAQNMA
jgi:hypothetical protein